MEADSHARSGFLSPEANRQILLALDRQLGVLCTIAGLLLLAMWWTGRTGDRHGMIFLFIGAWWIGPAGPLFLLARLAMRLRWRFRWLIQLLPIAYLAGFLPVLMH